MYIKRLNLENQLVIFEQSPGGFFESISNIDKTFKDTLKSMFQLKLQGFTT